MNDSKNINNGKLNTQYSTPSIKILVAGVGGQGVVFLTNLLVKAALLADIPVATSEIHGLSQRGGSVTSGITLGENTYGFLEKGGVDIIFGLEPLEAQRNIAYLNKNSVAIIDDNKILPYAVNSGSATYPDIEKFIDYLKGKIQTVLYNSETPEGINSIQRNLYVLGRACTETKFPIGVKVIEQSIIEITRKGAEDKSLAAFRLGLNKKEKMLERG